VDHGYIGLQARGRGFAELWSLEPAIENQNFLKVDSFSESRESNEYAFQNILTSILFELFDLEVRDADCWSFCWLYFW
jgi:hypothetical protein